MTTDDKIKYYLDHRETKTLVEIANDLGWKNKSSLLRFLQKHRVYERFGIEVKNKARICEVYYIHNHIFFKTIQQISKDLGRNYGFVVNNYKKYYGIDLKGSEISNRRKLKNTFKKGSKPHNKGLKCDKWMSEDGIKRQRVNRFKKGQEPHNIKPIGSEYFMEGVGFYIKTSDNTWKLKSHIIWEKSKGYKIDRGFGLGYKDKNKKNCVLENLFIIHPKHNIHNCKDVSEINETEYLMNRINKIISK